MYNHKCLITSFKLIITLILITTMMGPITDGFLNFFFRNIHLFYFLHGLINILRKCCTNTQYSDNTKHGSYILQVMMLSCQCKRKHREASLPFQPFLMLSKATEAKLLSCLLGHVVSVNATHYA